MAEPTPNPSADDRYRLEYIARQNARNSASNKPSKGDTTFDHTELALFKKWADQSLLIAKEQLSRAVSAGKGKREAQEALWNIRVQYYEAIINKIQFVQEQTGS